MNNYLKIFSSCVPVRGVSRSTICDFERNKIRFIPNDLFELIENFDGASSEDILNHYGTNNKVVVIEYLDFLIENEFAFWCNDPDLFPKLDSAWESPVLVENGIVDVNKNSNHNFSHLFRQYESVGCRHLQIRFFDYHSVSELLKILSYIGDSRISSIELVLKYKTDFSNEFIQNMRNKHVRVSKVFIHSSPKNELKELNLHKEIYYFDSIIDSNAHCGNIGMSQFVINQETFLESLNFNSCLNKKVSIDVNGDIKNCPSMKSVYGNITDTDLKEALNQTNLKRLWTLNKDQIETCNICEFRHVCTDCRAFLESDNSTKKPKKCNYDPYKMIWVE